MNGTKLDPDYWNRLYKNDEARWDVGAITPPLKEYFDKLADKDISILIPGAGNSYEGEDLLKKGFTNVTILDYAPRALSGFRKRVKEYRKAKLVCNDFFEHKGKYDLIIEQTFFCALDPALRPRYVKKMHQLLKPGGKLVGLLFTSVPNAEGPPFAASRIQYKELFSEKFSIKKLVPCYNSIKPRAGRELFFTLIRK